MYEIGKPQRFQKKIWKNIKIPKDIEKNKKICFSFNILKSIKTFWNITIWKMFIFKKFQFGIVFLYNLQQYPIPPKATPMKLLSIELIIKY